MDRAGSLVYPGRFYPDHRPSAKVDLGKGIIERCVSNPLLKKIAIFVLLMLLASCERPATISSSSPVSKTPTLDVEISPTLQLSPQPEATEVIGYSNLPTFDLADLPEVLPQSVKGYELVSWKIDDEWNFTLVTGTNRMKTFEELISIENIFDENGYLQLTVQGVDEISEILERIPPGETVTWGGINLNGQVPSGTIYFSYPPQEIMQKIQIISKEHNFDLITLEETE